MKNFWSKITGYFKKAEPQPIAVSQTDRIVYASAFFNSTATKSVQNANLIFEMSAKYASESSFELVNALILLSVASEDLVRILDKKTLDRDQLLRLHLIEDISKEARRSINTLHDEYIMVGLPTNGSIN